MSLSTQASSALPNAQDSVDLAKNLLNCFVISIVAYIATNVVREMLQMRVRYQDGVEKIDEIDKALSKRQKSVDEQNYALNTVTRTLKNQAETIVASTGIIAFAGLLRRMSEGTEPKLLDLIKKAFDNISQEAQVIYNRLQNMTGHGDQLQRMYLHVLNPYVEAELRIFDTQQGPVTLTGPKEGGIVTRFSVAGEMVRGLLKADGLAVTFHALLVIPPARFLNYTHPPNFTDIWGDLSLGDAHWQSYLKANLEVADAGIVERQFLAITCDSGDAMAKLPHEAKALWSESVEKQLNLWVKCKDGLPISVEKASHTNSRKSDQKREWYPMAKEKGEGEWLRLADVIGSKYHTKGKCFVREIRADEFTDSGSKIGNLLNDKKGTGKPFDYFAARKEDTKEWLFCLRMRYDENFDVAILDILYPGSSTEQNWNALKIDLDFLFNRPDRRVEITEYPGTLRQDSSGI